MSCVCVCWGGNKIILLYDHMQCVQLSNKVYIMYIHVQVTYVHQVVMRGHMPHTSTATHQHTHTRTCTCTHTCTHTFSGRWIPSKMFPMMPGPSSTDRGLPVRSTGSPIVTPAELLSRTVCNNYTSPTHTPTSGERYCMYICTCTFLS